MAATFNEMCALTCRKYVVNQGMSVLKSSEKQIRKIICFRIVVSTVPLFYL